MGVRGTRARPSLRSDSERNALVVQWRGLVTWVVNGLRRHQRLGRLTNEEAESAGCEGLIRAAELFEPALGNAFSTYAVRWIRQSIYLEIEHALMIHVPAYLLRPPCALPAGRKQDHRPRLLASAERVRRVRGLPFFDGYHDPSAPEDRRNLDSEDRESLAAALAGLNERDRLVITGRFEEGLTLAEIGLRLGVSRERVRQLERKALAKLRATMSN